MRTRIHHSITTALRITALVSFLVGPVGAFAYAQTGDKGPGLSGAGYVLYVTLQRNSN
jgi:hypothetical protein